MIRLILVISCLFLLGACNSVPPHLNVYDGLIPAGSQPSESPIQIDAGMLKTKTAVLVTTTNFNNFSSKFTKYLIDNKESIDSAGNQIREPGDVRNLSDKAYSTLLPYFKSVKTAANFAEAKSLNTDYIALIDFHGFFNAMGDRYLTKGGLYILDSSLQRVLQAEGSADLNRDTPVNPFAMKEYDRRTMTTGMDITTNQILVSVHAKLGAAMQRQSQSQIEPTPQNADDIKTLIANNNMQGLRTYLDDHPEALSAIEDSRLRLRYTGPAKLRIMDIEQLVKNKKKDAIIIAKINSTSGAYKNFTDDEMAELQKMNISDEVVAAMITVTAEYDKEQKRLAEQRRVVQAVQQVQPIPVVAQAESNTPAECLKLIAALKACDQTGGFLQMGCKGLARSQFNCPNAERYMR